MILPFSIKSARFFLIFLLSLSNLSVLPLHSQHNYEIIQDQAKLPILTPSFSKRKTAKIKLQNDLEVYLISDPEASQSGAVLTVQVGSWDDPDDYPGLAHFLEHMLFLGTEKYPLESDYDKFIRANGGQSNAYTTSDYTLYLFSVNHQAFPEALDRFSSFFKTPLFNPSGVSRELNAIDQEFAKNLNNDDVREHYVQKEQSNPKHPYHRFTAGNTATLSGVSQPLLKNWYNTHYSAHLMKLIVYSSESIKQLTKLVTQDFSEISTNERTPSENKEPLFEENQKGQLIYIAPIRDQRTLRLTWEIPLTLDQEKIYEPETLLCYVLGHEGKGSLLASLRKDHLAKELSCESYRPGGKNLLFSLHLELTPEGLEKIDLVIKRCFQALSLLKQNPFPQYLFDEVKKITTLRYQYQSAINPFEYLMKMGGLLAREPLSTFPEKVMIPQVFDPFVIETFLHFLTPNQASITILAPKNDLPIPLTKKEHWIKIDYDTQKFNARQLTDWNDSSLSPDLSLPEPNIFIPDQMSLTLRSQPGKLSIPSPKLLINNDFGQIYFYQDDYFQMPEVVWSFQIQSPLLNQKNPLSFVCTELYVKSCKDILNTYSYPAALAELKYGLEHGREGLVLTIKGYSDKAKLLFNQIIQTLKNVSLTEAQFQLHKQTLLKEYLNFEEESALEQSVETFKNILYQDYISYKQKIEALQALSYPAFNLFAKELYQQTYLQGLLYGNIEENLAYEIWKDLKANLSNEVFPKNKRMIDNLLILPEHPHQISISIKNPSNAALLVIQDNFFSFITRAAQQIFSQTVGIDFFATLRTKQQTGYLVFNGAEDFNKHLFTLFAVQSNTHDPQDLLARFELFLENFLIDMDKSTLNESHFEMIRQVLLEKLSYPPQNLLEMGELLKILAFKYKGDFERINKRIQGFKDLTYEDFLKIVHRLVGKQNKRRLAILVKGTSTPNTLSFIPVQKEELKTYSTYNDLD